MTRRACIAIDFDVAGPGHVQAVTRLLRGYLGGFTPNVEVTVLDDGAPTLPAAPAPGPATSPRSKQ